MLNKNNILTVAGFIMGFPEETHESLQDTYDMMDELKVHRSTINTLIPFPGTKLFDQVIKEKLLIKNWNLDELWKTPISMQQSEFIIKPYKMSVEELVEWREKLDVHGIKYWKNNPNIQSRNRYNYRIKNSNTVKKVHRHDIVA